MNPAMPIAVHRPEPSLARQRITRCWLWLAVFSLIAAGLMALLLATSRTPWVQDLIAHPEIFRVALVVHVDLSVLIWFFACAGALWSFLGSGTPSALERGSLALMVLGTLMITAAPFVGAARPLMNNYVPVLRHPWFFAGLILAATGLAIQAGGYLHSPAARRSWQPGGERADTAELLRLAMAVTAVVMLTALAAVAASWLLMPAAASGEHYYELLFWGGGHVLQFAYTVMLLAAWLVLTGAGTRPWLPSGTWMRNLLVLSVLPLAAIAWLYTRPLESAGHLQGFTELMRWGGLACLPLAAIAVISLWRGRAPGGEAGLLHTTALCSMILFAAGGAIGFLIRGSNTMIPAHYHGSIVAVTLALMGLVYYALPRLQRPITAPGLAAWQPWIYTGGQLLHVIGLAWCGGYGVQRKVAGAEQGLEQLGETAGMALMGIGGLVSVVGGVMFLLVVMAALVGRRLDLAPHLVSAPSPLRGPATG